MVEIKFLKELPVRSLNKTPFIQLSGADIYVDKDANRFAFFGFKNYVRSPMFSLYLVIKQYDSFGSFIRETKFSLPSIYVPTGSYVTEKPIRIADECEGCEVYISYAEFATKQFYQDKIVKKSYLSEFTQDYFAGAPSSVTCSINSNIVIQKEASPAAKLEEAKKVEPFKQEEAVATAVAQAVPADENVAEATAIAVENADSPTVSKPVSEFTSSLDAVAEVRHYRRHLSLANLIILGACVLAVAVLAIVLYSIF